MKNILIIFIILSLLLFTSCNNKSCSEICSEIPEKWVEISQEDLEQGRYYGGLNQKKVGTPDDWIHYGEGTRSASWSAPNENNKDLCDCNKWTNLIYHAKQFFNNIKFKLATKPHEIEEERIIKD